MKYRELLIRTAGAPVFTTGLLLAGAPSPGAVRIQLARWAVAGRVVPLRRGVYTLAEPYRRMAPHPFLVANTLKPASYVSLQSALAHHGLIPEHVPVVTSVTTGRPEQVVTPVGAFAYRHIKAALFGGAHYADLGNGQQAFIATPEKALLDLFYLEAGADTAAFIAELRLQHLDRLDLITLDRISRTSNSKKLARCVHMLKHIVTDEYEEVE